MSSFPSCQNTKYCTTVSFVARSNPYNTQEEDLYACSVCAGTLYSGEELQIIQRMPVLEQVRGTIDCAKFILDKVKMFIDEHGLENSWGRLLPEHRDLRDIHDEHCERLKLTCNSETWENLTNLGADSRGLLNRLIESDLMKSYNRELNCRQFISYQNGDEGLTKDTQEIVKQRAKPLEGKLVEVMQLAEDRNAQIAQLRVEKRVLEEALEIKEREKIALERNLEDKNSQIAHLNQTVLVKDLENRELITQVEEYKTEVNSSGIPISYSELESLYNSIFPIPVTFDSSSDIYLNLEEIQDQYFLSSLLGKRLPKLNKVTVIGIYNYDYPESLNYFLSSALNASISNFRINFSKNNFNCSKYLATLNKVVPRIPEEIDLNCLKINKSQFEKLFISCKLAKSVQFRTCMLKFDSECKFEDRLKGAKLSKINFECTGRKSNWDKEDNLGFKNIIQGLAEADEVRDMEIGLYLSYCQLSREKVEEILRENRLNRMTVKGI